MKTRHFLAAALLAGLSLGAAAQNIKPGLWEVENKLGGSDSTDAAMVKMQAQLDNMPSEQRKMVKDMMSKHGVTLNAGGTGGTSVKLCITQEMADRGDLQTSQGSCTSTGSPRVGKVQKIGYTCTAPPSRSEGEITYLSTESYMMSIRSETLVRGSLEKSTINGTGKFLGTDCGTIKPAPMPTK